MRASEKSRSARHSLTWVSRSDGCVAPRRPKVALLLLVGLYALAYLAPLGERPLLAPDEVRYAEIAREMVHSGDWVVPQLNGLPYLEKPALGYWMQAASLRLLGAPWAARLPSALATGLTALTLAGLLGLAGVRGSARWWTPVVFLTGAEVYVLGTFAILDPMFSAGVTGTLVCAFAAWRARSTREQQAWCAAAGISAGLAFLVKGLLAFALPAVVLAPFLLWERRVGGLGARSWVALVTCALVILPWAVAIQLREEGFWPHFFWVEHVERYTSPGAQHVRPAWFLVPYLIAGTVPWTPLLPAALRGLRARGTVPLVRFALCWILGPLLLLSSSRGKLGTYVLPCLPAFAILLALGLSALPRDSRGHRTGAWVACAACALLAGLVAFAACAEGASPLGGVGLEELRLGGLAAGLGIAAWLFAWAARSDLRRAIRIFAVGAWAPLLTSPWVVRDASRWAPVAFVMQGTPEVSPHAWLVADSSCVYALNLALARNDVNLLRPGELAEALEAPETAHRLWGEEGLVERSWNPARDRDLVACMDSTRYRRLRARLPTPWIAYAGPERVLAVFRPPRAASPDSTRALQATESGRGLYGARDPTRATRHGRPLDGEGRSPTAPLRRDGS